MSNVKSPLRFDHREIAVIFSLFVFVSLLMFTVGILVGKGLAQARYENILALEAERIKIASKAPFAPENLGIPAHTGTSVKSPETPVPSGRAVDPSHALSKDAEPKEAEVEAKLENSKKDARLELVPQGSGSVGGLKEPVETKEVGAVLANPKLRNIFEAEERVTRAPTSLSPKSFSKGTFMVQVGSYPIQKDAEERVETLKKLGFPHAFFSAKEIQGRNDTWFRVWLGYFPDEASARLAGQSLKTRGEVKDYLVREADKASAKN